MARKILYVILESFAPLAEVPRAAAIDVLRASRGGRYYVSSFTIMFGQNV